MSIIADTLKHLQARSTGTTGGMPEEPSLRPTFNQGEGAGRHLKSSCMKFWIIGVGMTVGLSGLALAAFWIGWQLDFGLSTNTHAQMDNNRPITKTLSPSEIQITTHDPSGPVLSSELEIAQSPPTPASHAKEETTLQTSMIVTERSQTPDRSSPQASLESRPVVSPPEPPALRESSEQQANAISVQSANHESPQIEPRESSPEEPPPLEKLAYQPNSEEVETPHIVAIGIEEPEGSQPIHSVPLKEEFVPTEELFETAKLSTNLIHRPSGFTTLKERRESVNPAGPATLPLEILPANRLRYAQELIQMGNYEEAVAVLSPLFHEPPINWQAWFWMGTALLGQKDLEQADQFFLSGLARNDKIPQLWIQRALVAQQRENYELAVHELRQAESLDADLPHIHLNLGYAYEQLGNDRLANQYYGKFLKLSEGNSAFFSTRKKLFARLTRQTQTERQVSPSASSSQNP